MKYLMLPLFLISFGAFSNPNCHCGSFETSIITFYVAEEGRCCTGTLLEQFTGTEAIYEYVDGAWVEIGFRTIDAIQAQTICCGG